ncbi:MAG: hypothetical protein AAGF85_00620 [Bacteroidota bacterium]
MAENNTKEQQQAEEIAKLKEELKQEKAAKATLADDNQTLKEANATLEATAKEAVEAVAEAEKAPAGTRPEFSHGGKTYVLVVPKSTYTRNGEQLTITEKLLKEDKKLLAELIDKGSGVLVEKSELTYKKED